MNKNVLTIILLIVFFPVGLYLMWAKTNWNKTVKIVITVLIAILALVGLFSPNNDSNPGDNSSTQITTSTSDIREFKFMNQTDNTIELELKNTGAESKRNSYFTVSPNKEVNIDDIEFISENPEIATFTYDKTALTSYIYFDVTAVSAGETYIYVQTKDKSVVSDKIKVIVTEEETTTIIETTTEEPTVKATQDATTAQKTTTTAVKTTAKQTTTQSNKTDGRTVYKTPSGKRYHFDPDCGGKNSSATSLDNAISMGLTPCQKCAN